MKKLNDWVKRHEALCMLIIGAINLPVAGLGTYAVYRQTGLSERQTLLLEKQAQLENRLVVQSIKTGLASVRQHFENVAQCDMGKETSLGICTGVLSEILRSEKKNVDALAREPVSTSYTNLAAALDDYRRRAERSWLTEAELNNSRLEIGERLARLEAAFRGAAQDD